MTQKYTRDETYSAYTQDFIRAMQEAHALGATRFEWQQEKVTAVVEWDRVLGALGENPK